MKRLIKKSLYKIFVSLFIIFYSFLPQSIVIGQVIEEYSQDNVAPIEEVIIPEESLPQEEVVIPEEELPPVVEEPLVEKPVVNEVVFEEPVIEKPTVEPVEVIKEIMSYPATWVLNGDTATTYDVVELGKTYIAPQNSKVRVIFTKIPENPTKLTIEEITLTQEEIEATGAVSDKAYDIKTDMIDGTFEYDLVLPSIEEETKVVYVEEREDIFTDVKKVANEVINEKDDTVKVKDLNHFTIFIVSATVKISGQVNGSSQVTVTPGQTITVTMEVELSGSEPNDRHSTQYKIGNNDNVCLNNIPNPNRDNNGSHTVSFDIVAPNAIGTYNLRLRVYDDENCSYDDNNDRKEITLSSAIIVANVPPVPNPALRQSCGLDIALVLDVSGSINDTELNQMKTAFKAFVDALAGTPTQFSVTKFDTTATVLQTFTSDFALVKTKIDSAYGGNFTNWQDSFVKTNSTLPNRSNPNLVIFASDGNPNRTGLTGSSVDEEIAVINAVAVANTIKTGGTRILALGIGSDLDIANMKAISGNNANTGDVLTSDVISTNFSTLAAQLATFASQTCGGTLTIHKLVTGLTNPTLSGWNFTVNGQSYSTDSEGLTVAIPLSEGTYSVTETSDSSYNLTSAVCSGATSNGTFDSSNNKVDGIQISNNNIVSCTFTNSYLAYCGDGVTNQTSEMCDDGSHNGIACTPPYGTNGSPTSCNYCNNSCQTVTLNGGYCGDNIVNGPEECDGTTGVPSGYSCSLSCTKIRNTGTITVDKITNPSGDQTNFPFTVVSTETNTNETFNLADQSTPWSMTLPTGVYTVSEGILPSGWTLSNTSCVSNEGPITNTFYLDNGENVTCTFTNTKLGSISGTKWKDMNGDGNKDAEDLPILGWTIKLDKDADGSIDQTMTTDNNGVYTFSNLLPGTYKIIENTPSPWNVSYPSASVNYYTGINLTAGANLSGYDFGNYENGQIKGYKWEDVDGDGIKETGEGVPTDQWQIKLWKKVNGLLVDQESSVYTDPTTGVFSFSVTPGTYYLSEVLQTGWTQTQPSAGSLLAPDGVTRLIGPIVVTSGSISEGNNFGNFKNVSITVCKWKDLDGVILTEDQTTISGWSISLIKDYDIESIDTKNTEANGCAQWLDIGPGSYEVTEKYQTGWTNLTPTTHDFGIVQSGSENFFKFINTQQPITIKAYKIVCTDESQLPNWGTGGPNITASTAQDWVNSHNTCSFVDNWNFQWGNQTASNPGDNTGETSVSTWHKFGPTVNGLATVEIPATEIEGFNSIWMREVWNSNYIPFTYNIVGGNSNDLTAEIYCHTDVLNYDNLDRIDNIQNGDTYYCVAWNVAANPGIEVEKSGPDYAINGENITYKYEVTNKGNVPLTTISVTDDKCTPVQYESGDDGDNALENGETWKYECTTTIPWTFPTAFTNKAEAKGYYFDRELKDEDEFSLYPFTLRKDVLLYWDGDTIQYSDPNTKFDLDIKKGDTVLGTKTISESSPLNLWLSDGTYHFCEKDLPLGYIQGYDGCINYTTGQGYPDWSQINVITFDLAIDKTAPSVAYKGETIIYEYMVTNSGPASVTPVVVDPLCTPVYDSGDTDIDGKVDPSETWKYTCNYVVTESGGATITNTATVHDKEGEEWDNTGWYLGGDRDLANNTDTVITPVKAGSIRVCKLVLTPDGKITDGSEVSGFDFSISGLDVTTSQGAPARVLPLTSFSTPLNLNKEGYECVTYTDLPIGHFYYGEESYASPWNEPKYNDSSININSAIYYSGELFDDDTSNDGQRNTVGDGDILLTQSRLDRTLLVVNQYPYSSIQGRKYYDVNINGDFDSDEKKDSNRLNGWTINLYDNQWNLKQSMVTGDDTTPAGDVSKGQYRFENVLAGTYYVCEEPKTGWYQTEPSSGIQHNGLYCHTVNLGYAEDKTEIQFGNYQGSDVNICKKDNYNRSLSGWDIVLASEQVQDLTPINVSNASGTDSNSLPAGKYLIEVSGTYRYGNSNMNADAGYSYRPNGIPSGCDCWLSGNTLTSKGLMAWVNDSPVNWGAYNENHIYTYVYEHEGGVINISIRDDQYSDNLNNNNFAFEIYKVEDWGQGTTTAEGCITLKAVPYGEYILDEYLPSDWLNLSGKNVTVQIDEMWEHFTIKNRLNRPVTIEATKIVCDYEEDLPNWGNGHEPITATTAQDWIKEHPTCSIVPEWEFEWGYEGANNPGDEHIGYGGENWNTFTSSVEIDQLQGTRIEVREVLQENYIPFTYGTNGNNSDNESAEFYCNTDVLNYDNWEWLNRPEYGQTYYCVGFNTLKRTDIHGQKWHDLNRNGVRDCQEEETNSFAELLRPVSTVFGIEQEGCVLEPLISDLRIFIDDNGDSKWNEGELSTLTSADPNPQHFGWYWFEDLLPGKYTICEEIPEGWAQTYPGVPAVPQCHTVTLPNDCAAHSENGELRVAIANTVETYCEFDFGNTQESVLYISETNDSWPNILTIGDTFTYIITVRAAKGPVTDVTLINLPSEGFVPQSSTFSAISSIKGALDTSGVIYASPGKWYLGDLDEDEEVTITYKAIVMDVVDPGVYPDLTYAYGLGVTNSIIIALSESSGFPINEGIVNENVVGTQIKVEEEPELDEGEVLGASQTLQLPRTGASGYITLGAILAMITGFILILIKPKKKIATLLLVSGIALGFIFIKPVHKAYAETNPIITVKVEQPETPTQETSFKIGYVSLPIPINTNLEIRCYEESYGVFGPIYNQTSGNCIVEEPIVQSSGTYTFYITVQEVGNPSSLIQSEKVEVVVDLGIPGPLSGYTKVKGACSYTLTFNTANDGRTSKVQIFRSDIQPFKANESTLVKEMGVEPDKQYSYEDPLPNCGKEYFYAIRAVDELNNVSTLVTDDIVTIVRTPAPITPTEITGEEKGEVAGEETTPEEEKEDESGEVKGDEDVESEDEKEEEKEEDSDTLESFWSDYKYFIIAVLVVALGSGAYKYVRRKK